MKLSVIIPAYNEQDNIRTIISRVSEAVVSISAVEDYQIIVIDDHSTDNTFGTVRDLNDEKVLCLRLSRRSGTHTALRAGLKESDGAVVLFVSADGQDDPFCLEAMLKKWGEGAKVVWALRKDRRNEPWCIRAPAQLFYILLSWLNRDNLDKIIDLSRADFYLLDRAVVDAINGCPERNTSIFGLVVWLGFNQSFVEYDRRLRQKGKSKWNFRRRLRLALDWILAFSSLPVKLISIIGIMTMSVGFVYSLCLIFLLIQQKQIEGWAYAIAVMLILSGIQMLMLGLIGEYVWRNIDESRNRPVYFVEDSTFKFKERG